MSETAARLEAKYIPDEGTKVRLLALSDLDGRTSAVKRVMAFERQLASDLGDDLSAAQSALARRSAVIAAVLDDAEARWAKGEPLALTDYLAGANCLRRLVTSLGLKRSPRSLNGGDRLGELLGND